MKELYHMEYTRDTLINVKGPHEDLINTDNIWGNCSIIYGDARNLTGDVTNITGEISGLTGDITSYGFLLATGLFGEVTYWESGLR